MYPPAVRLLLELFEASPNVYFCVKDVECRYLAVSEMFVRLMGMERGDFIGRTVHDFTPPDLARLYEAEDRALLTSGEPRTNRLERVASADGERHWFMTNRALHRDEGFTDVIVAVSTPINMSKQASSRANDLRRALELAERDDRGPLRVSDLAAEAQMTSAQLTRVMRQVLGIAPKPYLMELRARRAATLLVTSELPLHEIAVQSHYYDQSQFTTHFKSVYGVTPLQFRSQNDDASITPP